MHSCPRVLRTLLTAAVFCLGSALCWQDAAIRCQAAATSKPVEQTKARLRIACYNVENLFDNYDDPYRPDEGTSPKSDAEIAVLAKTIDALDADVLALEEVENREVLKRLNARLEKPYAFVEEFASNDMRGIDCAILSRIAIRRSISHRYWKLDGERRFARDLVVHELAPTKDTRILIAPMHFKSKRSAKGDPQSKLWRGAEARAVLDVLADLRKLGLKEPFVLLGDLNDTPDSEALAPLFAKFTDATRTIPAAERWSFEWSGKKQQIDYVLYDGALRVQQARFVHEEAGASDHAPCVVDFVWPVEPQRIWLQPAKQAVTAAGAQRKLPAISATDPAALKRYMLREVEATGVVRRVQATRGGGHFNLLFGDKPRSSLTVFVPRHAVGRFGDLSAWQGKTLTVRGPLFRYRGRPEIQLTRKSQVTWN